MNTQSVAPFNGQIAFVDAGVTNSSSLIAQFKPGTEVHQLDSSQAAIEQITQVLSSRSGISAVHIVSHGSEGALQLGGETISDLSEYDADLKLWSQSLTTDADILLYGCNVAADGTGKAFVNQLGQLTGADVAASDDLTGLGGDWNLEYQTGTIETISIAATDYSSTLANFTVTTLNDVVNPNDGVISLREAINAANALDGTDNIFFGVNGTFTLGGSELTISSNLNIFGNGASFTTISGNNAIRVFNVNSGTVLLSGLTIANGQGNNGSGIRNSGNLTVNSSTFSRTFSGLSAIRGGAIYNEGSLTVNSSTFSGNSASSGGGIFNVGNLTVNSSTFSGNFAKGGGGIFNEGSLTVNSSTFSGNEAVLLGGGIDNRGSLMVNSSTFSSNEASPGGGGIYNEGSLTATSVLFTGNQAVNGAGLYTTNEAVVDFCTFTNNHADDDGGGIYASGVLNLGNSYFQNNRATNSGGGLYLTGSNAKVSLSTFLSNSASEGGAIGLGDSSGTSTLLVTDSVLRFNSATSQGGGIFAGAGDSVTIRRSQVRQNTAPTGPDLSGAFISGGFNLIGTTAGSTGIVNGVNGDVVLVP